MKNKITVLFMTVLLGGNLWASDIADTRRHGFVQSIGYIFEYRFGEEHGATAALEFIHAYFPDAKAIDEFIASTPTADFFEKALDDNYFKFRAKISTNLLATKLTGAGLYFIPPEIGLLENLNMLKLENGNLTRLPSTMVRLKKLEHLCLSVNAFTDFPVEILGLTQLVSLWLDHNELSAIPDEIGLLTNLKFISVASNKISSLPETIGNISGLNTIYLDKNSITSLPGSFKNLSNLITLGTCATKLTLVELHAKLPERLKDFYFPTLPKTSEERATQTEPAPESSQEDLFGWDDLG